MGTLILLRHAQSQWGLENRLAGWADVPLTPRGQNDAMLVGKALNGYRFELAFTSRLQRAMSTLDIVLRELRQTDVSIQYDSALNERHYGEAQGREVQDAIRLYGEDHFMKWFRGYFAHPPGLNGESMEDCERRVIPFLTHYILPHVFAGKTVLVSAHGVIMRPIFKYLDSLEPDFAASMEVPMCTPYVYTFDGDVFANKQIIEVDGVMTGGAGMQH